MRVVSMGVATGLAMSILGAWAGLAAVPASAAGPSAAPSATIIPAEVAREQAGTAGSSSVLSSYALTATAAAISTDGTVGATGGLVTLDSGQASVITRLDSTPRSSVRAQPVRPGSAFEEVASQVPAGPPVSVPEADAAYPGLGEGSVEFLKGSSVGPLSYSGGTAAAQAAEDHLSGRVADVGGALSGVFAFGATTATVTATADATTSHVIEEAHTTMSELDLAGVLVLRNVDARATIRLVDGKRSQQAEVTIGSATVGGQAVSIGSQGITAAGQMVPGTTTTAVTKQLNDVLANVGITVKAVGATTSARNGSQYADTGGVEIDIHTPDLPAGIAGNIASLHVGAIVLTETDEAAVPRPVTDPTSPAGSNPQTPTAVLRSASSPPFQAAAPVIGSGSQPKPSLAASGGRLLVAGVPLTRTQLFAGLAAWQFLSLMTPTLYALASRRSGPQSTERSR